jgi:hypothetical protein
MKNTADVAGGKPLAVLLQSISLAINPLVIFYDIHGGKREVLFFILSRKPHETLPHHTGKTLYSQYSVIA